MSEALAIREQETALMRPPSPREVIAAANEDANALSEVLEKKRLYVTLEGRKYVRCEGWTTLCALRGVMPREVSVEEHDGVFTATVELVRMKDGAVLTRASAECGAPDETDRRGEPTWAKRPRYARRSMAITRATSKAARIAFSWVLALAGEYEVTPAEEVPDDGFSGPRQAQPPPATRPAQAPRQTVTDEAGDWTGKVVKVKEITGTKNGKAWTLYAVDGEDGTEFATFDKGLAEMARIAEGGSNRVRISWEKSPKGGRAIVRIEDAEGLFDE